jgi:hypothetical protein
MSELEEFRQRKDLLFKENPQSPLPLEEKEKFSGLKYYPLNPDLKFGVPLEKTVEENLEFETSSGELKVYKKIGGLNFKVGETAAKLTLYQAESGSFFLPFRDATSGQETYGAGRYLEVKEENGNFELDFNYAYNPYCAYGSGYSCPLPPMENWLKVPIAAGEKKYYE